MKKMFVINQSVQFDPLARTLIPLEKPENKVQLHTPVSECLLLLLMNNGETLSQKFLADEVWVNKGHYVTTNSLYQNIAAIRRGLRAVGLDENILKTIPKSGFQFYASITEVVEDTIPTPALEMTERTSIPPTPDETVRTPLLLTQEKAERKALLSTPEKTPEITSSVPSDNRNKKNLLSAYSVKVAGFLLAYVMVSMFFFHLDTFDFGPGFLSTYTHIGNVDKCELYSSYTGIDKSTRVFRWLMHSWGQDCSEESKAWLTFNANYRISSILICDINIEKNGANCKSLVYSGDIHE